ncbi:glycoside hydrolase family 3 protein, partial [Sphaerobolus stellatus SS14]
MSFVETRTVLVVHHVDKTSSLALRPSSLLPTWQASVVGGGQRRGYAHPLPGGEFQGMQLDQEPKKGEALKEFSIDLTDLAKQGKLDSTIGRDEDADPSHHSKCVMSMLQCYAHLMRSSVFSRRTKSNPILIGPPGVGKMAIVEGLALRIVGRLVLESLFNKRVLSLDLASIFAGTGIRGQFESKFKALLKDIEEEEGNMICFIDEMHTLLNLGKAEGAYDAYVHASLSLTPSLTDTPLAVDEYRKHIEKDAALERCFQHVIIDEPTVGSTISILRRLKSRYEVHHGVEISDGALVTGLPPTPLGISPIASYPTRLSTWSTKRSQPSVSRRSRSREEWTSPMVLPAKPVTGDTDWASAVARARQFVAQLTLEEKANLTIGVGLNGGCVGNTG